MRKPIVVSIAVALTIAGGIAAASPPKAMESTTHTATPIKHLVVIFQENVSFDHYFGTYPQAANQNGEPPFHARSGTPTVNGLSSALLVAVFPANVHMALNPEQVRGLDLDQIPRWALWARLPLQPLAMLWVWRATRD